MYLRSVFGTGEHPNVPSFRFWYWGTSAKTTLLGNRPFAKPREKSTAAGPLVGLQGRAVDDLTIAARAVDDLTVAASAGGSREPTNSELPAYSGTPAEAGGSHTWLPCFPLLPFLPRLAKGWLYGEGKSIT